LSGFLSDVRTGYSLSSVLGKLPSLHFSFGQTICPACSGELVIQSLKTRKVYTVNYGTLQIKEHKKQCISCGQFYGSERLPLIVKKGSNYSYDCMVQVGLLRYREKKQISEIIRIFDSEYHFSISATQVRRLAYSFLHYLGKFHYLHTGSINNYLASQGGYILYIDSTCEGRAPHLLTCIDGISGFVLYSQKLVSENQTDLKNALRKVKKLFGNPLCCVNDMGRGINSALDVVFPFAARVICHFHLLRDIGKDLLNDTYQKVRKLLAKKEIYSDIRYQTKALEKQTGGLKTAQELFYRVNDCKKSSPELLQGILYGYLQRLKSREYNGDGYGFPFDRPKLVYYNDIKRIYAEMESIENLQVFEHDLLVKCRFYKIKEVLGSVLSDNKLADEVKDLELHIEYFDQLRDIMRITIPGNKKGLNDPGKITSEKQLRDVETELKKYVEKLKKQKHKLPKVQSVIKQLEKYWEKIFAGGIETTVQGQLKTIFPQRTNNTSEQFYRRLKQHLRRLHGNSKVNKDLLYLPEEIALIENLSNHQYINHLMKNESQLATEFAKLDIQGKKLPYEKEELELVIPHKIKKTLKNFRPLECLKNLKY
jgi:hypothetical protein